MVEQETTKNYFQMSTETKQGLVILFLSTAALIAVIAGCNSEPKMVPKQVLTTNNGVITTNIVMVRKFDAEFWAAVAEGISEGLQNIDFDE